MKKKIRYYKDAWFKVEYSIHESHIDFKAWKITGLDDIIENSDVDEEACLTGFIKWDGCCEFDYGEHICGVHGIEQFSILMDEIYKFKNSLGDNFTDEFVPTAILMSPKDVDKLMTKQSKIFN